MSCNFVFVTTDPFMDPWTKAAIVTVGILITLLATVFAWKYYMQKVGLCCKYFLKHFIHFFYFYFRNTLEASPRTK